MRGLIVFGYFLVTLLTCGQASYKSSLSVGAAEFSGCLLCFCAAATFWGSFLARRKMKYSPIDLAGIGGIAVVLAAAGLFLAGWSGFRLTLDGYAFTSIEWAVVGMVAGIIVVRKRDALPNI